MGIAEFNYNLVAHSGTKQQPCNVVYGVDPFQPVDLALEGAYSTLEFNQDGEYLAKNYEEVLEKTKLLL